MEIRRLDCLEVGGISAAGTSAFIIFVELSHGRGICQFKVAADDAAGEGKCCCQDGSETCHGVDTDATTSYLS